MDSFTTIFNIQAWGIINYKKLDVKLSTTNIK